MKKTLFTILTLLLSALFLITACDSPAGVLPQETTAAETPAGSDIVPDETTADIENTKEELESTIEEETTNEETEPIPSSVKESIKFRWYHDNAAFFDYHMLHRAKSEDFKKVQKGMTFSEVIEIIGRPHGMWGSGFYKPYWYSLEGYQYVLSFREPYDENGEYIRTYSIYEYADLTTFIGWSRTGPSNIITPVVKSRFEDPYLKELPSYEDLMNLPMNMTVKEVTELYGKPQYYGLCSNGDNKWLWVFYTAEGIEVGVDFQEPATGDKSWDNYYVKYVMALDPQVYFPEYEVDLSTLNTDSWVTTTLAP